MSGGRRKRQGFKHTGEETKTVNLIHQLTQFEDFQTEVLPKIQRMLKEGKKAEDIIEFAQAYAAARMVTIALTDQDSGRAATAAKDVLDRSLGKAKERSEIEHKYSKLKDEELDALLASKLEEADDDRTDH